MKKFLKFMPLLLIAVFGTMVWSCSDDDNDDSLAVNMLPDQAKEFVAQYFPSSAIIAAKTDGNEYDVMLSDGTKIEFDKSGEWKDVDAARGATVPSGFYPETIDTYVAANYEGKGINEISKETGGYDVELVNGVDLKFDSAGQFVAVDR
ncbi:MAG: PepSY-like domain-containing protein [Muribaculaceae bacterium]|nr:PepSY-like domain-containing protein [Muribaculaceae bacterium]